MSLPKYMRQIDRSLGTSRGLTRLTSVVGETPAAIAPPGGSLKAYLQDVGATRPAEIPDGVGTLVGAVAGGYLSRGTHPILGVIGGASLGRNLPALMRGELRGQAVRNLAITMASVFGSVWAGNSRMLGSKKLSAAAGFILPWVVGNTFWGE